MKKPIWLWLVILLLPSGYCAADYGVPTYYFLKLYQMMKDTHEILKKHKLVYWIHAGTLLGAVRHKGLMSWDDDVDIVIKKVDEPDLIKILPEFKSLGYIVAKFPFGYKIVKSTPGQHNVCLDIMLFVKNDRDEYSYPPELGMSPEVIFFKTTELFPLKKYQFGEITIMGPQNPIPYLDRVFKNWSTHAVIYNHHFNGIETIELTEDNLKPAQPTGPLEDHVAQKNVPLKSVVDFSIEEATEKDVSFLASLLDQMGFPVSSSMCLEKIRHFAQQRLDKIWVAKINHTVVGLLCLNIITPLYHPGLFARIDSIVVDKEYRNLGLGKQLLTCAEEYAHQIGCQRIFLTSGNHRIEAHEFYKKMNYQTNATYFVKYLEPKDCHVFNL